MLEWSLRVTWVMSPCCPEPTLRQSEQTTAESPQRRRLAKSPQTSQCRVRLRRQEQATNPKPQQAGEDAQEHSGRTQHDPIGDRLAGQTGQQGGQWQQPQPAEHDAQ
ncbi:hypothetical protein IV102_27490 [bacterium]|nr:hypothetical protein [bacterium]